MSKRTEWADDLSLSASGKKLVGKAGIVPVRRLADKVGLTDALGAALVRRGFRPVHDRGTVLVSAACAVLLGARSMAGIDVMRQTSLVLGRPASASTLWRTLEAIGPVQQTKIAPRGPGPVSTSTSSSTCARAAFPGSRSTGGS